tara:strand:- start:150 stop:320 length:171 start_codon:yes stop_codon:yes gene_type:complete
MENASRLDAVSLHRTVSRMPAAEKADVAELDKDLSNVFAEIALILRITVANSAPAI